MTVFRPIRPEPPAPPTETSGPEHRRLELYAKAWQIYVGPFATASLSAKEDAVTFARLAILVCLLLNALGLLAALFLQGPTPGLPKALGAATIPVAIFCLGLAASGFAAIVAAATMLAVERRIARMRDLRNFELEAAIWNRGAAETRPRRETLAATRDIEARRADRWRISGLALLVVAGACFPLGCLSFLIGVI